jgi:ribosomal protein S12 methylthiotransferase accessory factor
MTIDFPGGLKVNANYQGMVINTDQPVDEGGEGSAPEPFVLFVASLATCTGVTMLAFCRARDIDTQGMAMTLGTQSDPDGKGLAKVEMNITLPPGFPEKYHKALLRVAGMCAVKKALQNPPEVVLNVIPGD